ncbi:MAG: hypothetical protein GOU97_00220 [Nanoarchaeota archaeon]|nr:hypothetical protein [Nanoarchaeota archaeon]
MRKIDLRVGLLFLIFLSGFFLKSVEAAYLRYYNVEIGYCFSSMNWCQNYGLCEDCYHKDCINASQGFRSSCEISKGCVKNYFDCSIGTYCLSGSCISCDNLIDGDCSGFQCPNDPDCLDTGLVEYEACKHNVQCLSNNCVANYTSSGIGEPANICCDAGQCAVFQCGPPCLTQCINWGQCATQTKNILSKGYFPEGSCELQTADQSQKACGCVYDNDYNDSTAWDPVNGCCDSRDDNWFFSDNSNKTCDEGRVVTCRVIEPNPKTDDLNNKYDNTADNSFRWTREKKSSEPSTHPLEVLTLDENATQELKNYSVIPVHVVKKRSAPPVMSYAPSISESEEKIMPVTVPARSEKPSRVQEIRSDDRTFIVKFIRVVVNWFSQQPKNLKQ